MNFKRIFKVIVLGVACFIFAVVVNASEKSDMYSEGEKYISFPMFSIGDNLEVTVRNITDYELYYQFRELTSEEYDLYENKIIQYKAKSDESRDFLSLKPLRENYESDDEYNAAMSKYSIDAKKLSEELKQLEVEIFDAVPDFSDEWNLNADNNISIKDKDGSFILYVKVVDKENSNEYYNNFVRKMRNIDVEDFETDNTNNNENSSIENPKDNEEIDDSSNKENEPENPNTGIDNLIMPASVLLIVGMFSLYLVNRNKLFKRI